MADYADEAREAAQRHFYASLARALAPPAGCEQGPIWHHGRPHCRDCDAVIPEKRLKAVPGTGLCVTCAALAQTGTDP
ncbi:TraR/DksA C4-type zinc finger protein [Desulfovibrio sp. OttesenSCG-928-G11]|nr:TraR/DksA C4-type zinc finger protein [Desulfovibrio sp. OttesenSCG-928-G11]